MTISAEELEALSRVISESTAARAEPARECPQPIVDAVAEKLIEREQKPKREKRRTFTNPAAVLAQLDKNANGDPQSNLKNAIRLLRFHPSWNAPEVLYFDEFSLEIRTKNPTPWDKASGAWQDVDDIRTADWMQSLGVVVTPSVARDAVELIAKETLVHPVRSYLQSVQWDRNRRVDKWLSTYLGVEENALNRAIGKCWLVSAVARIFRPGCQADHVLSLEGPQGVGKSTALRVLAGDQYFSDHISDLASKDSRLELLGKWVIELSELGPVRRSDNERTKGFLSARFDCYRPPYGRRTAQVPRQCVFAASFNDQAPFTDATGNRRFWPVSCGRINVPKLKEDRDQLWAEAYALFLAGAIWYLDSAELNSAVAAEQSDRMQADAWDELVLGWADDPQPKTVRDIPLLSKPGQVTVSEVLMHAIGKSVDKWDRLDEMRVSHIFVKSGWRRRRVRHVGSKWGSWFYFAPKSE